MTLLGRLISFFPLLNITLVVISVVWFFASLSAVAGFAVVFFIYLFPVICFHLHNKKYPIKQGLSDITKGYSPWYGSHMIQSMHLTFPVFERLLRLIPGAFSIWLRLWGSKVGKHVYWTPHLEILDRNLLEIGDNCIFGHSVKLSSHVIRPSKRYGLVMYVKTVVIKDQVFLGAESRLGPGVILENNTELPACSDVYPNSVLSGRVSPNDLKPTSATSKGAL